MGLPAALMAGMVLVGASPGGTASNVICYLARGDVALSVILTSVSTLLAPLLTPALTWLYAGERVPVPAWDMVLSTAQVVLGPVALGLLARRLLGARGEVLQRVFPLVSVLAIVLIIAIIVALNQGRLGALGPAVLAAVVLHNGVGLAAGYGIARLAGLDAVRARTLGIEVGMQNSGLAVALAVKYFPAAAALPGAVFSIWHNLSGAALAAWWSRRGPSPADQSDRA
jgi:BASS family bile acid:Na+ symporter